MTIQINQQATSKGKDWWDWSVWLEGDKKELDAIEQVVYTLHPTFPNPIVTVADRKTGFRLDSSGWGEFTIYVQLKNKDGSTNKRRHYLKLHNPKISKIGLKGKIAASSSETETPPRTVFVSGGTRDLDAVQAVRDTLSKHNVEVLGPQDVKSGQELQRAVNKMISRADAAVFVISGRPNLWQRQEINTAVNTGVRHILPLIVGENVEVPEALQNIQAIHVDSESAVADMAEILLNRSLDKK